MLRTVTFLSFRDFVAQTFLSNLFVFENKSKSKYADIGGFHLHLLVFLFISQFNSRIGVLVHSSFAND